VSWFNIRLHDKRTWTELYQHRQHIESDAPMKSERKWGLPDAKLSGSESHNDGEVDDMSLYDAGAAEGMVVWGFPLKTWPGGGRFV
jgi:hypothetical protein